MSETTFTESYLETIDELLTFTEMVSGVLNTVAIKFLGEGADWSNYVGLDFIPSDYLSKFEVEDRDFAQSLWTLREQSNSILNWNADHDLSEWVKNLSKGVKPDPETEQQNIFLQAVIKTQESQHAKALQQAKDSHQATFNRFKGDVIVCLKALELCAIASQRHGEIALNHHVRDMRLEHLQGIVLNAIKDFSDRRFVHYNDDF